MHYFVEILVSHISYLPSIYCNCFRVSGKSKIVFLNILPSSSFPHHKLLSLTVFLMIVFVSPLSVIILQQSSGKKYTFLKRSKLMIFGFVILERVCTISGCGA